MLGRDRWSVNHSDCDRWSALLGSRSWSAARLKAFAAANFAEQTSALGIDFIDRTRLAISGAREDNIQDSVADAAAPRAAAHAYVFSQGDGALADGIRRADVGED